MLMAKRRRKFAGSSHRRKSKMEHNFASVPRADIPRSSFDRSHGNKTTFDGGYLVPIFVDEALPGDTFSLDMTAFARLATPIFPIMDNMYLDTFFFSVPHRLIWDNWEKFCGAQDDPGDSIDFVVPTTNAAGAAVGSIHDYFGIPPGVVPAFAVNALPFRAYNLIWRDWFRDENLQDSPTVDTSDGPDVTAYTLFRRGKRHDYFTSSLPWAQKGAAVDLPLGTEAPVLRVSNASSMLGYDTGTDNLGGGDLLLDPGGQLSDGSAGISLDPRGGLIADLSDATAATINQLREAFQVQKLLERDARGGTRYTEVIKAHFGVTSPDARLQRPEYLGGGSTPVNISAIAQTSETATTPQATLSAIGTVSAHNHGFTKSFTEHCVLIGLVSVRADLTYQQGLNRMWSRSTRYDYYWPALSHIGEQAVLNKEIFADGSANDALTFGYQERYAEYRYAPSLISGLFRSDAAGTLDAWHLAQDFASLPALNSAFIEDTPPIDRIIAVPTEPHFLFDSYFKLRCARPMPLFATPGLIDHF